MLKSTILGSWLVTSVDRGAEIESREPVSKKGAELGVGAIMLKWISMLAEDIWSMLLAVKKNVVESGVDVVISILNSDSVI